MFSKLFGKPDQAELAAQLASHIEIPGWPAAVPAAWLSVAEQQATLTVPFALANRQSLLRALQQHPQLGQWSWQLEQRIAVVPNSQPELPLLYGNVIAVASGKGGVGKSSVTVQLALALAQSGAQVGILDADLYGPSLPTMLGSDGHLGLNAANKIIPQQRYGVTVSSLGYVSTDAAAIWRGPVLAAALQQLFRDTAWPRLDYLLIDLPPGTGDVQLTMAQKLPVSGALIVTTPQTVALADADKAIQMFRKVNIPLLGVLENMSVYQCPACGHQEPIFGQQGGVEVAAREGLPLLGQWPLQTAMRAALDAGKPLLVADPQHPLNESIRASAQHLAASLYHRSQKPV